MIELRPSRERGRTRLDWLDSYHTFSFNRYQDGRFMGFRSLRVINEDFVSPGEGFGPHPHRDMEIVTYVLEGALEHQDSLDNRGVIRAGELQHMTAGSGIFHSEYNHSPSEPVHFLQIWIAPWQAGLQPCFEQRAFDPAGRLNRWQLAAGPGQEGALTIQQDARLYLARLDPEGRLAYALEADRHAWVQVAGGACSLNGVKLEPGDGAAVSAELELALQTESEAEILMFDLA